MKRQRAVGERALLRQRLVLPALRVLTDVILGKASRGMRDQHLHLPRQDRSEDPPNTGLGTTMIQIDAPNVRGARQSRRRD